MPGAPTEPPAGFTEFSSATAIVVCAPHVADAFRAMLSTGTLYEWASRQPDARPLVGRGIAYAVALPGGVGRSVVRHNRHGGLLAPITGDVFRAPTRAPDELEISETLRERGVPVATTLGYATYPAWGGLRRADVVAREVPNGFDLAVALCSDDSVARTEALAAAAATVAALGRARAWHADLNIKNLLLHRLESGKLEAVVLDVDAVRIDEHLAHTDRNLARLRRSALKWRTRYGARVTDAELDAFERDVRAAPRPDSTA